jgi:hypothetical protein
MTLCVNRTEWNGLHVGSPSSAAGLNDSEDGSPPEILGHPIAVRKAAYERDAAVPLVRLGSIESAAAFPVTFKT